MSLHWNEELAVGHPVIDAQHRGLFEKFGEFLEACDRHTGQEQLIQLFNYVDTYVTEHFRDETALMERFAYPEIDFQRREHDQFRRQIAALRQQLEQHGATVEVLIRSNKALIYWLTEHIRTVDTKLATFLHGRS